MNSRERLTATLEHRQPNKVVIDIGSTGVTAFSATVLTRLREKLGMEKKLVKCYEPYFGQAEMEEDDLKAFGVDVVRVAQPYASFGYKNDKWKKWTVPCGVEVLVGEGFTIEDGKDGYHYIYPQGDKTVPPSARIPYGGFFADCISRQEDIDEDKLDARKDFANDFKPYSDEVFNYIKDQVNYYNDNTEYGINVGGFMCGLGDAGGWLGPSLKKTPGIRNLDDWMCAFYTNPDYVKEVYALQEEVAMSKLKRLKDEIGDKFQVIQMSATDFGTQNGEFISPELFREFYKPIYTRLNNWVHENTNWKTFYHSCGSIVNLLDDFVEMGVDILNPVQTSAKGMDPKFLKEKYGDKFTFWGGGVDTQKILPFGTPEDVFKDVYERLTIFAPGGGFVFNPIHNVVGNVPPENLIAMFDAIDKYNNR